MEIQCPRCQTNFEADDSQTEEGSCPNCGNSYEWEWFWHCNDEDEYSDEEAMLIWQSESDKK